MGLVEKGKVPKPLGWLFNQSRRYSLWMYQWGLACCGLEMAAAIVQTCELVHSHLRSSGI